MNSVKDSSLTPSLLASCLIHALVVVLASVLFMNRSTRIAQNLVPIDLVELPRVTPEPSREKEIPVAVKPALAPPPKNEKLKRPEATLKKAPVEQPAPPRLAPPSKDEVAKSPEPVDNLPPASAPLSSTARVEGGGSEAGAGNLFSKGDVGVVPGSGTSGGGGGTAAAGLGRGAGSPGLPAPTTPLRTHREAKPVQTVRASYPPMALRIGLEGDVTLRIEVDTDGKVTRTEVLNSGGPGFDEEAIKAVKQARFEPAQKDGKNVPAEFTYVYRFRLKKQ